MGQKRSVEHMGVERSAERVSEAHCPWPPGGGEPTGLARALLHRARDWRVFAPAVADRALDLTKDNDAA